MGWPVSGHVLIKQWSSYEMAANKHCHWDRSQMTSSTRPWTRNLFMTLVSFGRDKAYLAGVD